MRERVRGALHVGVKRALTVVTSHYARINLEAVSEGFVVDEDKEDDATADEELLRLVEAAEAPGAALAARFEEEVALPPMDL